MATMHSRRWTTMTMANCPAWNCAVSHCGATETATVSAKPEKSCRSRIWESLASLATASNIPRAFRSMNMAWCFAMVRHARPTTGLFLHTDARLLPTRRKPAPMVRDHALERGHEPLGLGLGGAGG